VFGLWVCSVGAWWIILRPFPRLIPNGGPSHSLVAILVVMRVDRRRCGVVGCARGGEDLGQTFRSKPAMSFVYSDDHRFLSLQPSPIILPTALAILRLLWAAAVPFLNSQCGGSLVE